MIYISQGHERGIGLEIFFKTVILLTKDEQSLINLFIHEKTFLNILNDYHFSRELFKNIKITTFNESDKPQSTTSLTKILEIITDKDLLVTLPTSKDQLILNKKNKAGYTEFFRDYYHNDSVSMIFKSFSENVLLLTDHLPLSKAPSAITEELVLNKIKTALCGFDCYFNPINEIIFSGINPHSGENGILGNEDQVITKAISKLQIQFPLINIFGPLSGDTLHTVVNTQKNQLFVYAHHDQGLASFKARNGFIGLNLSFGLSFLRLSVDHGTAFDLYGKNKANISGMSYLFKSAFEVHHHVNK
jgi:4-hydroxythreonine-4-phosphate dehydrogenase